MNKVRCLVEAVKELGLSDNYLSLPHDLAGSRSKNRFRIELLWGVSKLLDLMEAPDNFTMVFDYVCDIEVHRENGFDFFQIKSKGNTSSFTANNLTSKKKEKGSILGKLYALSANAPKGSTKVAIVTNAPYHAFPTESPFNSFSALPEEEKEKLEAAIKEELSVEAIDFSNVFYIHTTMDLEHPENSVRGHLVLAFERIKRCEPKNPNALYRLIYDTVTEKACYEYSANDYKEILKLKGLSRKEFDELLDRHAEDSITGIQQAKDYISSLKSVSERHKCNVALPKAIHILSISRPVKQIEARIAKFLSVNDIGDTEQALDELGTQFDSSFPVEISKTERFLVYLIVLKRFEGGAYTNEVDF